MMDEYLIKFIKVMDQILPEPKPIVRTRPMDRDEWMGMIQTFLEERIKDAPDDACKQFAEDMWQETAEFPEEGAP